MKIDTKEIVILGAVRTPIGTYKGSLKNLDAHKLGSIAIKNLLKKTQTNEKEIEDVIMGQVLTAGSGQNPARQAAINAGIPINTPAHVVNQVCGSGLRAVISGYQSLKLGEVNKIIAGGQENMSIAPHSLLYRDTKEIAEEKLIDTMINDDYQMFVTYAWIDQEYDHAQSLNGYQSTRDYRMGPIQANLYGVEGNFTTTETADASLSNYTSKQFEIRVQSDLDSKTNGTGGLYYSTTDSLTNYRVTSPGMQYYSDVS